jgi:hypothetical protein
MLRARVGVAEPAAIASAAAAIKSLVVMLRSFSLLLNTRTTTRGVGQGSAALRIVQARVVTTVVTRVAACRSHAGRVLSFADAGFVEPASGSSLLAGNTLLCAHGTL